MFICRIQISDVCDVLCRITNRKFVQRIEFLPAFDRYLVKYYLSVSNLTSVYRVCCYYNLFHVISEDRIDRNIWISSYSILKKSSLQNWGYKLLDILVLILFNKISISLKISKSLVLQITLTFKFQKKKLLSFLLRARNIIFNHKLTIASNQDSKILSNTLSNPFRGIFPIHISKSPSKFSSFFNIPNSIS